MARFTLLHHHHRHRSRQLRWVLPVVGIVLAGAVASGILVYEIGDRAVSTEFFRAHKTISETGQLLRTGLLVGLGVFVVLVAFVAVWSFRLTHRIVRPVHTLHQALDKLAAGELGTRVEFHRHDEFQEIADALNRLAGGFADAVRRLQQVAAEIEEIGPSRADDGRAAEVARLAAEVGEILASFDPTPRPPIQGDGPADAP
jgi:methyl-accepting chemotaxis protein